MHYLGFLFSLIPPHNLITGYIGLVVLGSENEYTHRLGFLNELPVTADLLHSIQRHQ